MEADEKENEQEENVVENAEKRDAENVVDELGESEGGERERNINISISFGI